VVFFFFLFLFFFFFFLSPNAVLFFPVGGFRCFTRLARVAPSSHAMGVGRVKKYKHLIVFYALFSVFPIHDPSECRPGFARGPVAARLVLHFPSRIVLGAHDPIALQAGTLARTACVMAAADGKFHSHGTCQRPRKGHPHDLKVCRTEAKASERVRSAPPASTALQSERIK